MSERTRKEKKKNYKKTVVAAIEIPNHEKNSIGIKADTCFCRRNHKTENWESYEDDMKEYLFLNSFKVIGSSNNMEVTQRKKQSTFSETTVLQCRQSTTSLHFFL